MEKKITCLHYNWMPPISDGKEIFPEQFSEAKVGRNGVDEIIEHRPQGEGDKWFYDIVMGNGTTERIFNPNWVLFE